MKNRVDNAQPNELFDVRAKQRLCYRVVVFPLACVSLRAAGFAPRQLNRSAAIGKLE